MMSLYVTLHCDSWWGFHFNLIIPGHFHGFLFVQYFYFFISTLFTDNKEKLAVFCPRWKYILCAHYVYLNVHICRSFSQAIQSHSHVIGYCDAKVRHYPAAIMTSNWGSLMLFRISTVCCYVCSIIVIIFLTECHWHFLMLGLFWGVSLSSYGNNWTYFTLS